VNVGVVALIAWLSFLAGTGFGLWWSARFEKDP
jgi:hypothetical protein